MAGAIGELELLAQSGDSEAQLALGRHLEAENKTAMARGWFARAARQGNVAALRQLAINLLTKEPIVEHDGVNMIRSAAHKGDAEAAYVCGMLAAQDYGLQERWSVALQCLAIAGERGWELARAQLEFLGTGFCSADAAALTASLPVRGLCDSPRIEVVERFASAECCDWLIERARPGVARAMVYDAATGKGRVESARSNSAVTFNLAQSDMVLMLLRARIAATAKLPPAGLETPSVLHYAPGQQFELHVDFLDPNIPVYARELALHGQRVATFLLYLNEDYEGGETEFPELNLRHKGSRGDALLFWNVSSTGVPDMSTSHAGLQPTSGHKWLLSQWLRQPPR
jgi:prolyl 4-hydroxylase